MPTMFLLPCPACHNKTTIDLGQAGDRVICACGEAINVPTLREVRRLEQVEVKSKQRTRSDWSFRQGLMLVGLALLLAGSIPAIYFYVTKPVEPSMDVPEVTAALQADLDQMPLVTTWFYYQRLLSQGLIRVEGPEMLYYQTAYRAFSVRLAAALGAAAVGLLMLIVGWTLKKPQTGRAPVTH